MNEASPRFDVNESARSLALPRLHIIHLLMWMAATAVAFLPYRQTQKDLTQANASVAADLAENPITTFVNVAFGVMQGACLFVVAAVLVWKRRGYAGLPQPGHYFAYRTAALWAASLMAWIASPAVSNETLFAALVTIPYVIVAGVFFLWFLRLSRRTTLAPAWRRAFAVTAVAPLVAWILTIAFMFARLARISSSMAGMMALFQGGAAALIALVIILAMMDDRRHERVRHWSHYIGPVARAYEAGAYVLIYGSMRFLAGAP
jgi:hypothetical protein